MNTTRYKLPLPGSMMLSKDNKQPLHKINIKNSEEGFFRYSLEICQIEAESFYMLAQKHNHKIFAITMVDIEKALNSKPYIDSWSLVPEEYHNLLDIFDKKNTDKLPLYHEYDIGIDLEPEKTLNFRLLYSMLQEELQVLCEYLDKHLAKEFIQPSCFFFMFSVLFVKKSGEGLHFCIDYWVLNIITVQN